MHATRCKLKLIHCSGVGHKTHEYNHSSAFDSQQQIQNAELKMMSDCCLN